ncbi:hypothetical protein H6F92_02105 [Microcystis wesenbergii FACHB-1317]|nr:hypothetical protein [Microcystis wesenbergii FACHB-1317]
MVRSPKAIAAVVGLALGNAPYGDSVLLRSAFGIALLIPKKRSPLAFLSRAMTISKFNQEDDSDRTTRSAIIVQFH